MKTHLHTPGQVPRRWNTEADNGTTVAFVVACAKTPSAQTVSYQRTMTFTVSMTHIFYVKNGFFFLKFFLLSEKKIEKTL